MTNRQKCQAHRWLSTCEFPACLLPGWGNTGREIRGQMSCSAVHPPSFDVGCEKGSSESSPSTPYLEHRWYLPLGDPQLLPPCETPFRIQSSLEEPERRGAPELHLANRLSEMKEQLRHLYPYNDHHISGKGARRWGKPLLLLLYPRQTLPPPQHSRLPTP